eukprot:4489868-Pyramimonas_sp.AAC.1
MVRRVYNATPDVFNANFFENVNGQKVQMIFRHPVNDRDQEEARQKYISAIKDDGVMEECRSDIVGVYLTDEEVRAAAKKYHKSGTEVEMLRSWTPSPRPSLERLYLLAGATLIEAAYMAHAEAPELPNVKLTIETGVK